MLRRATDLGDWLLPSLATESGVLVPTYRLGAHSGGGPVGTVCLAEVGSIGMEFVRLSQVTGDPVYAEAVRLLSSLSLRPSRY
jgi:mannosyl-oligosaccharide alpha-1,2-mannosidase